MASRPGRRRRFYPVFKLIAFSIRGADSVFSPGLKLIGRTEPIWATFKAGNLTLSHEKKSPDKSEIRT